MNIPPTRLNLMKGGVDISLPNVSYCEDIKDIHYTPYNLVRFYVGEITEPQTVNIYTDNQSFDGVQVSKGNKWYTYVLPKDKGLLKITGNTVTKVIVKANINDTYEAIISHSTVEASFKDSDTSKVTNMNSMFDYCNNLTSLDLSGWDTSKVTDMSSMFYGCNNLNLLDLSGWDMSNVTDTTVMFDGCTALETIRMVGCSQTTIDKIKAQLTADGLSENIVKTK